MNSPRITVDFFWIFLAMMFIFFWNEPDLVDALIQFFMSKGN
jgi:uncharacterized membrane protein YjjP (DUF1212 family)